MDLNSQSVHFCCPRCRGPLTSRTEAYQCRACGRDYPVVFGIPDFRLEPDPYISFEEEYRKASTLNAQAERLSFEQLVRFYWEITPNTPPQAAERYVRFALSAEPRGHACVQQLDRYARGRWTGQAALEIGCGTGGFLVAAHSRCRTLIGADIALRWLIIAKKRLSHLGSGVVLVCCSAEHLPFAQGLFDSVIGVHVLEHTNNPQAVLSETARTLKPGGLCFFSTPNRFSLGPEPCVRVWGVGFVPRCLAEAYVRLVKGLSYKHIRLLSFFELRRLLGRSGLRQWSVAALPVSECEKQTLPKVAQALIAVYHALLKLPLCSIVFGSIGPFLQVVGRR